MPDTFANPLAYNAPIGSAVANLSRALLSGPSEAERIRQAEAALKLKREREATGSLADIFGTYGQSGFNRNSAMTAAILGGYDPQNLAEMERYGAANTFGATDPRTANAQVGAGGAYSSTAPAFFFDQNGQNVRAANALAETVRNNNVQSGDRRYGVDVGAETSRRNEDVQSGDRRYGVDATSATSRFNNAADNDRALFEFNNKPMPGIVDGKPVFVPQSGATAAGVSPVLSNTDRQGTFAAEHWNDLPSLNTEQQRYLNVDADSNRPTPRNYIAPTGQSHITYDGVVDAQTGAILPPGGYMAGVEATNAKDAGLTTSTRSGLQQDNVANDTLKTIIGVARDTVNASPDVNFGVTGNIKTLAQNLASVATNLAQGLGFTAPADALATFQAEMRDSKVDPSIISGIFDPRLGELQAVYGTLVYATARALSGGGTLSNQDVQAARDSIGDPTSLFGNKQTLLSKLDAVEKLLNAKQGVVNGALNPSRAGAPTAAQPAPSQAEEWVRGPDGRLVPRR